MYTIDTSVMIAASPHRVWEVLVDFPRYPEWNPFIRRAEGDPEVGATLMVLIQPPGADAMTHHPTVQIVEPGRRLQWLGKASVPGLFHARHEFILRPADGSTSLRHYERFGGLAVPFLRRTLRRTEQGPHQMNEALKQQVEALGR